MCRASSLLTATFACSGVLLVAACSSSASATAGSTSAHTSSVAAKSTEMPADSPTATATYTRPPAPAPVTVTVTQASPAFDGATADRAMCQVTAGGGTFWIHIASAGDHNFTACAGSTLQADNLDTIFASGPNVDRRCLNSTNQVAVDRALIGVYSSSAPAGLAAAHEFCAGNGWNND